MRGPPGVVQWQAVAHARPLTPLWEKVGREAARMRGVNVDLAG